MDEVGRGTTVKDGLAIAFAVIQHLYVKNQCRALFATHFHEIVDMFGFEESSASSAIYPAIAFSCTDITENSVSLLTPQYNVYVVPVPEAPLFLFIIIIQLIKLRLYQLTLFLFLGRSFFILTSHETRCQSQFAWAQGGSIGRDARICYKNR